MLMFVPNPVRYTRAFKYPHTYTICMRKPICPNTPVNILKRVNMMKSLGEVYHCKILCIGPTGVDPEGVV